MTFMEYATSNGDSKCIEVPIIDDEDYEGDHQFTAELNPIQGSVNTGPPATITIHDDGTLYVLGIYLFKHMLWS